MVNTIRQNKMLRSSKVFDTVVNIYLTICVLLVVYPIIFVVSSSLSSADAIMSGSVWLWPVDINIEGYKAVFSNERIWNGYLNTIIYTGLGTAINIILTVMLAYPLSRKDFVGGKVIMMLVTFTMIFNGGIIPTYLVVKNLGMINTLWAMVIPTGLTAYNTIITRTFFRQSIPDELFEAARIDGCTNIKFITSIVLPLSKSIIAVIGLFYAVMHWNSYFTALIYIRDELKYPLQLVLRQILIQNQTNEMMDVASQSQGEYLEALLKYGVIVVSIVPMLIVYPFVQKYFVKGVMVGSLKG